MHEQVAVDDQSPTPVLSRYLAETTADDLPSEVLDRTRYLLLDGVACGLVGAKLPWSQRAVKATRSVDNGTGATLIGWDDEVSPLAASLRKSRFTSGVRWIVSMCRWQ